MHSLPMSHGCCSQPPCRMPCTAPGEMRTDSPSSAESTNGWYVVSKTLMLEGDTTYSPSAPLQEVALPLSTRLSTREARMSSSDDATDRITPLADCKPSVGCSVAMLSRKLTSERMIVAPMVMRAPAADCEPAEFPSNEQLCAVTAASLTAIAPPA